MSPHLVLSHTVNRHICTYTQTIYLSLQLGQPVTLIHSLQNSMETAAAVVLCLYQHYETEALLVDKVQN